MKKIYALLICLLFSYSFALSQVQLPPDSKPDEELTKDEAVLRIADIQAKIVSLNEQIGKIDASIVKSENDLKNLQKALEDCNKKLNELLGAGQADVDAFRQKLGKIEGKVREMQRMNDDQLADNQEQVKDLERQLNELRKEKVSVLPEFYSKIINIAKDIKGLWREKKIKSYTVGTWAENKDCLWNIADNPAIYADPTLWPKIWQANKDVIKNPDVIFPGQVLLLPLKTEKTSDEIKAERKYWRKKKEAAAQAATQEVAPATGK